MRLWLRGRDTRMGSDLQTPDQVVDTQDVITCDNVSVTVNAVLDSSKAIVEIENYLFATSQLAQTTL